MTREKSREIQRENRDLERAVGELETQRDREEERESQKERNREEHVAGTDTQRKSLPPPQY